MEICRLYCYKVFHGRKKTAVNVNHDKHIVCKMRALFILLSFADGACSFPILIGIRSNSCFMGGRGLIHRLNPLGKISIVS